MSAKGLTVVKHSAPMYIETRLPPRTKRDPRITFHADACSQSPFCCNELIRTPREKAENF